MGAKTTRRSQSVVPFGVGAIVEFEDEALMSAGLDVWPTHGPRLFDERLAQRLGVKEFREPPPKPERGQQIPGADWLPYVRFPTAHFCPRCRYVKSAAIHSPNRPACDNNHKSPYLRGGAPCGNLPENKRPRMVPLRFLVVCPAGHIEDFPWVEWAHSEKGQPITRGQGCEQPIIYFFPTKIGGLSGLIVECARCGTRRSLMGTTRKDGLSGFRCRGHRPWLGEDADETCAHAEDESMFVLQRGASNVYFPVVTSSILIPPFSSRVHIVAKRYEKDLKSGLTDGEIPKALFEFVARRERVDVDQLMAAVLGEESGEDTSIVDETAFRFAEYQALQQERRDEEDLLLCRPQDMAEYTSPVSDWFVGISLVEKLAETRALTGFNRITPGEAPPAALSRSRTNWLPAFRVLGEGIFLKLNADRLREYLDRENPRLDALVQRIAASDRCDLDVSSELILLHSLSHILIKRLSWEAGYGSSSIRERIYTAPHGAENPMSGILLYTAAGDADGTLGGLVRLGRARTLERVLRGALVDARWCASDPICRGSRGQGPESLNLAACHACMLLPETSCELQNRFLDRRSMVDCFLGDA